MSQYNNVILLGPTATGKTALAVKLAHEFNTEIISADSRQVYQGLDIGSGKDLEEFDIEIENKIIHVPYNLIDITTLDKEYSVFDYQQDYYKVFSALNSRHLFPITVGGTGMYIDSIVRSYNLVSVPTNPILREELKKLSLEEKQKLLKELKPDLHNTTDLEEHHRLIRAIEIETYMKSDEFKTLKEENHFVERPDIKPIILGLTFERTILRNRIKERLLKRIDMGLIEEVENLHKVYSFERLERLGLEYRFVSEYLQGKFSSKEEFIEKLYIAIGQFAKRQETWFRGMERKGVKINWIPTANNSFDEIFAYSKNFINKNMEV